MLDNVNEDVVRTFISVPVPTNDIIENVLSELRSIKGVSVPNTDIHITLKFLGDVRTDKLKTLVSKLDVLNGSPPFNVTMNGIGAFPNAKDPKVVWIGLELEDPFYELLSSVTEILDSLGIDYDRKRFKAHVTIGRVRRNSDELTGFLSSHRNAEFGSFRNNRIDVMSSVLTPSGAEHAILSTIELS